MYASVNDLRTGVERAKLAVPCRRRRRHHRVRAVDEVCCYDETPCRAVDVILSLRPAHPVSVSIGKPAHCNFVLNSKSYTTFFMTNIR
jgi:hypothetical protein